MHPKITGGILGQRDSDKEEAKKNKIGWIDLVVCNLPMDRHQVLFYFQV